MLTSTIRSAISEFDRPASADPTILCHEDDQAATRSSACRWHSAQCPLRVPRPMKDFLNAARLLLLDLASTLFFLVVYLLTHNTILAVGLGIALGLAQIGTQFIRR